VIKLRGRHPDVVTHVAFNPVHPQADPSRTQLQALP